MTPDANKSALEMAESSEWTQLHRLITESQDRAQEMDDFGMMPLHWACTDRTVPLKVIQALVRAYPEAVVSKNKGGLIPLHIAIKARANADIIKEIIAANENAVYEETPAGETAAELAQFAKLQPEMVNYLRAYEEKLRATGQAPQRRARIPIAVEEEYETDLETSQSILSSSTTTMPSPMMLPPRWKLEKKCKVCFLKFSYFKTRHHCRNCGESVCSTHSNKRLPLEHLGLETPQRVCILCYDTLRANGKPSSVLNLFRRQNSKESTDVTSMSLPLGLSSISGFFNPVDPSSSLAASFRKGMGAKEEPEKEQDEEEEEEIPENVDLTRVAAEMEEQVKELETHMQQLLGKKDELENAMNESNLRIKEAMRENIIANVKATELERKGTFDIRRISEIEQVSTTIKIESRGKKASSSVVASKGSALLLDESKVDVASTCNLLGMAFFKKGEYPSAIAEFRKSVALNKGRDATVWFNLARAYLAADEVEEAENAIQNALKKEPESYAFLSLLGKIYHAKGEHDEAIEIFRQALLLMNTGENSDSGEEDIGSMTVGW